MARQNVRVSGAQRMATTTVTTAVPSRPWLGFLPSMPKLRWAGPSRFAYTSGRQLMKIEPADAEGGEAKVKLCIDSMRTSSPTRLRPSQARPSPGSPDQDPWIILHPSALNMFGKITNAARGKQVVMFLDYDGTLSPIVEDPDRAFMSSQMREAVKDSAKYFPTAIVSGRSREKVYDFVKLPELYYAGSHGMDIKGPSKSHSIAKRDNKEILFQPASEFLPMIDEVYKALLRKTKSIPGAKVESNKFCCSVHYRCVDEKWWGVLAEQVRLVLNEYPKLKLTQGRKVLEIRPIIKWDKGKAIEFLLESLGFSNSSDVLPIYIGDDRTDEDAFKVLRDRGQGIGILVTKGPRDTYASYTLQHPSEVMDFLRRLVDWKKFSPNTAQNIETCRMNHTIAISRGTW